MDRNELGTTYHDVMDDTLNALQSIFFLAQRMEQQINDTHGQYEPQNLLQMIRQIEDAGLTIRGSLQRFSQIMETFLSHPE